MTRRLFALSITLLFLAAPLQLFAKGEITKIIIQGGTLSKPVEITSLEHPALTPDPLYSARTIRI